MSTFPRLTGTKASDDQDRLELSSSCLSKALTVNGYLESDGEIRVYGSVLGQIKATRLVVSKEGYVEGDVIAKTVHICGKLIGRVFAPEIALESTADIRGRIFHNTADVAKGALIEGRMPWRPLNFFDELKQPPEMQP